MADIEDIRGLNESAHRRPLKPLWVRRRLAESLDQDKLSARTGLPKAAAVTLAWFPRRTECPQEFSQWLFVCLYRTRSSREALQTIFKVALAPSSGAL
jgi:hypothetical protein